MTMFDTKNNSLIPLHTISAYWWFDAVVEGTVFPNIEILLENSEILEMLRDDRWITDGRITKRIVKTMDYIWSVADQKETEDRVRDGLNSLKPFYYDTNCSFIPDLTKLDTRLVKLLKDNDYIINKAVKAEANDILSKEINIDITSMKKKFASFLQPIFNDYCDECKDGTFTFREHQMYALLWFFDNMIDNNGIKELDYDDIRKLLIFHKTRSGKSITIAAIIIMLYHFNFIRNVEQQYNVFLTGFHPSVFHAVREAFTIDLKCNIPLNPMNIREDDIVLEPTGINLALCSFQYLYTRKNEMRTKKRLSQAQDILWHLMVIDEAHDARQAPLTMTEINKLPHGMQINMTATPNKDELLTMEHIEFTYREEQILKKLGYDKYKTAPKRLSVDLGKYSDVLTHIKSLNPSYDDPDDFIFHYDGGVNKKQEPKSHNDSDTIQRILVAIVNGIHITQFNSAKLFSIQTARRGYKDLKLFLRNTAKTTNNKVFNNQWVNDWIINLDALTPNDIKECGDSIIVMENTTTVEILKRIMQEDPNISRLFDVIRSHSYADDKMTTKELEELTTERGVKVNGKPRIIILCGQGLHGSTFKSINSTIFLSNKNSDARYKQAAERGGTYVHGKEEYFIMDFNPMNLVDFEPTPVIPRVPAPPVPSTPKPNPSFSYTGVTELTDKETKLREFDVWWKNAYDLRQHLPAVLKEERKATQTKMVNVTYSEGMKILKAMMKP